MKALSIGITLPLKFTRFTLFLQVVDLLNQAALKSSDEKLTVLKQVCSLSFFSKYCDMFLRQSNSTVWFVFLELV